MLLPSLILALLSPAAADSVVHGDVHERIARVDALILEEPGDASLYLRRSALRREDGDWTAAAADLAKAAELRPELAGLDEEQALLVLASGRAPLGLGTRSPGVVGPAPMAASAGGGAPLAAVVPLIPPLVDWKYKDDGVTPPISWRQLGYNDSLWAEGPAQLGYGDGDENTVVSFGPNPNQKYPTTWFRHAFPLAGGVPTELSLALQCDDGAIIYLNGIEVARHNLPSTGVTSGTYALTSVTGAAESAWNWFVLDPNDLVPGNNQVAVEIHQSSATSSDLSFDLSLVPAGPPGLARRPFVQNVSGTEATLSWRTVVDTDSEAHWGAAPGQLTQSVTVPGSRSDHEVRIFGLSPGEVVYYSIGDSNEVFAGDDPDHFFHTAPAAGSGPMRAWILGDVGLAGPDQSAVRDAFLAYETLNGPAELLLLLGDNAYPDGTDQDYQNAVFDPFASQLRRMSVWSTRGNHDSFLPVYEQIFAPPTAGESGGKPSGTEAYYSFDWGDVHFVCLDSMETDRGPNDPMAIWLAADLAANNARWTVAFFHHPPHSKGNHDSDSRLDSGGRMIDMRENLVPILEAGGVDLVLTGHSHSFERSMLLQGFYGYSRELYLEHQVDSGDGREAGDGAYYNTTNGRSGTVYAVAGSSSKLSSGTLDHPAMVLSVEYLGSLVLEVDGDRLDLRFLDDTGAEIDHLTMHTRDTVPQIGTSVLVAGQMGTITVRDGLTGAPLSILAGPGFGSAPTPVGISGLSIPVSLLASGAVGAAGEWEISLLVPPTLSGRSAAIQPVQQMPDGSFQWGPPLAIWVQ